MPPRKATSGTRRSYGQGREPAEASTEADTKPAAKRKLARNVYVGGRWYGPDYDEPPADVASRLGDHLWEQS